MRSGRAHPRSSAEVLTAIRSDVRLSEAEKSALTQAQYESSFRLLKAQSVR